MSARPQLCPYLGLAADSQSVLSSASEAHRCFAIGSPQPIELDYQNHYCLTSAHPQCPLYQRARPQANEPHKVEFSPAVAPAETVQDDARAESPARTAWLDRIVVAVAVAAVLFGIVYFASLFFNRPDTNNARPAALAGSSTPTPRAPDTPTPTRTPRPTTPAAPAPILPSAPTPPPNGQLFTLNPAPDGGGWVSSGERTGNHLGDAVIQAGVFNKAIYFGLLQFDLSQIPAGTKAIYASLDLIGARDEQVDVEGGGIWQVKLVNVASSKKWAALTFDDVRALPWDYIVPPPLTREQLGKGKINHFELSGQLLAALERQFGQGKLTLRIEGPTGGEDNLFAWESGLSTGNTSLKPVLHIGTDKVVRAEAQSVLLPCVPTPSDPQQRAALAATAAYVATVFGTPTPYPPNYVTPVVVTATPTPDSIFAAATQVARMTAQATLVGTATPTPINWVVPPIITPTPLPENQATAVYRSALATAQAATTGTPTPLPCFVQIASPTPTNTATPVVVYDLPSATPSPTPSVTPNAIPQLLRNKIVFMSDREGTPALFVMDPDGSHIGKLTNRWSYDTALLQQTVSEAFRLAVLGDPTRTTRIVRIALSNGQQQVLFDASGINYDPAFAPNGYDFAFVSTQTGHDELYRMNRDGGGLTQLTQSTWEWNKKPSWSPDGARLIWWSNREAGRKQIWLMNADGTKLTNLSNNAFNDWDPVWIR